MNLNKENKELFKVYFGFKENSKKITIQKNHLKQVAQQKLSLTTKKQPHLITRNNDQNITNLELQGASLIKIKQKPSLSLNKYTVNPARLTPNKSPVNGKIYHKPSIITNNKKVSNLNKENKFGMKKEKTGKNESKIIKFGEILNIFEMEDKNVNVNEEVDNLLLKLDQKKILIEDFDNMLKLDWFDVKVSNSFETLIDKIIEYFLSALTNQTNIPKEFKNYQKKIICFIFNGVEEFLFFDGITVSIFSNLIKIPFYQIDCLDILMTFLIRNSKKLYLLSEEKKESLINLLIISIFNVELTNIHDETYLNIVQISENLIKNNYIRNFFYKKYQDFIKKLIIRVVNICQKNSNILLKKSHLVEINLLLICLKYPEMDEKLSREEFVFNLINKLNNSLKMQREFPVFITFTFKKIRKILTNFKLYEIKCLDYEIVSTNLNKILKTLKSVPLQESLKTLKKLNPIFNFLTKK